MRFLDSVGHAGDVALMAHRIDAKYAQSRLLSESTFGNNAAIAARAARRAEAQLRACRLLLGDG
ncbi:hypothetical protein KUH32_02485 [Thalassococcus sp. CAU 1522]|uniref:Uncharacterized protein n=1 Tax=Thalassococcus arenae TaxID=2851652 RepID=A0ABS6N3N9_9RHOB|nr:hypothetical protein [Thalassococcus arenae]MBV2358626.1 hypothetical protein [Thalassococcus arenae]